MKSHISILIYDVSYKALTGSKAFRIVFNKVNRFIRDHVAAKDLVLFTPKNNMPFLIGFDILQD